MSTFSWTVADWLQASYICFTALGIVVTAYMAYWVVDTLQTKIDTEKILKDYFVQELKSLRKETRTLIENLIKENQFCATEIKRHHYSLQTHINDLLQLLNERYQIDKRYLKAYRSNISDLLEKDDCYKASFKDGSKVNLSEDTKKALHNLSTQNDHLFNEILLKIYGKNT